MFGQYKSLFGSLWWDEVDEDTHRDSVNLGLYTRQFAKLKEEAEKPKESAQPNKFIQGYVCAVANLLRERDTPAIAKGLLESLSNVTYTSLKEYGVDIADLKTLKKYKLI